MNNQETYDILCRAAEYLKDDPKVEYNPWPEYDGRVYAALGTLSADLDYLENYDKLKDKPFEEFSLSELATMYTFILRGERFCDGHIAGFIENGELKRLVERHLALLEKTEE